MKVLTPVKVYDDEDDDKDDNNWSPAQLIVVRW